MTDPSPPAQRDVDLELVVAADELERLPGEIAALVGPDGRVADFKLHAELAEVEAACIDVVRLAHATGSVGLRAKARAILAENVLDGPPVTNELVRRFAEDVLRLVPDETAGGRPTP